MVFMEMLHPSRVPSGSGFRSPTLTFGGTVGHKSTVPLLILALLAFAQGDAQSQKAETMAQTLTALENKWVGALAKSDVATLDSILSDTYVDTDEHGHRTDKKGLLSALKSGDLKLESIKLLDMTVHDYGDAGIVIGDAEEVGTFKGDPISGKIVFTDTFIRQNGKWKAVASHRSHIVHRTIIIP
jgi:hypothetical protein